MSDQVIQLNEDDNKAIVFNQQRQIKRLNAELDEKSDSLGRAIVRADNLALQLVNAHACIEEVRKISKLTDIGLSINWWKKNIKDIKSRTGRYFQSLPDSYTKQGKL